MLITFWLLVFLASLVVLVKAADYFTSASEEVGIAMRIPQFIVGVTIVGLGTSMPEFATGLIATLRGDLNFVWANVIGSNIANILLILGVATIIAGVITVERDIIQQDLPMLAAGTALAVFFIWDGSVERWEAALLIAGLGAYLGYAITGRQEERKVKGTVEQTVKKARKRLTKNIFIIIAAVVGIYFGAAYTVKSATEIALIFGIAPAVIAATAVAFGTSLPELAVSVRAAMKKKFELAIGNIVGSNLMNLLFIGGIVGIMKETTVLGSIQTMGIPMLILATFLMIFSGISKSYHRWDGVIMLLIYCAFIVKLFV